MYAFIYVCMCVCMYTDHDTSHFWTHNEYMLTDKNECNINNGDCEHNCYNTRGSYYCTCNTGYQLESNRRKCKGNNWTQCTVSIKLLHNCIILGFLHVCPLCTAPYVHIIMIKALAVCMLCE